MGKPRMLGMPNRFVPNSKADMRYRRKAYERNKSKIESEERFLRKAEREIETAKRRAMTRQAEKVENKEAILVHGAMKYGCEKCGLTWWMFLEKGLEEFGENHKPVPFVIGCPLCGGFARDISGIVKFPEGGYKELPAGEAYFANVEGRDCGVAMTDPLKEVFYGVSKG